MSRIRWWLVLIAISVLVTLLDIITGPYVQFPIIFVIPVGLAAWYLGRAPAIGFTLALVSSRLMVALFIASEQAPAWAAIINALIRLLVLLAMSTLLCRAKEVSELRQRISALEEILPICAFCKKVKLPDGGWKDIETYMGERDHLKFSHGFCEHCAHEHYPEYFDGAGTAPAPPAEGTSKAHGA